MKVLKMISLIISALYIVIVVCVFWPEAERNGSFRPSEFEGLFGSVVGMVLWLGLSLACIWWGDELAEGMVGAKFGLISSTSLGWPVKLIGWVLLLLPAFLAAFVWKRSH